MDLLIQWLEVAEFKKKIEQMQLSQISITVSSCFGSFPISSAVTIGTSGSRVSRKSCSNQETQHISSSSECIHNISGFYIIAKSIVISTSDFLKSIMSLNFLPIQSLCPHNSKLFYLFSQVETVKCRIVRKETIVLIQET